MKHHSNGYLPQSTPSGHPSSLSDHRSAMKEIARGQSLVTQLRAIVLPALQADERCELVAHMFQNILDCSSKAMTELQLHHQSESQADEALVDDKKRVRRISSDESIKEGATGNPHHQHKRRSYYRCTYRQEQDCKATKTVQQQDGSAGQQWCRLKH
nr:unnamed protein product [Digitaria exilis]